MPNVSMTMPTDYTAELQDIERRRKLAELMQQQGMQPLGPTEHIGGWAVKRSPMEGLAKMMQAYAGGKGMDEAGTRQKALAERIRGDRSADMSTFAEGMQPQPARQLPPDQLEADLGGGQYEPPQPMNMPARRGGITPGLISQLRTPEMQQAAMAMLAKKNEPYTLGKGAGRYEGGTQTAYNPEVQKVTAAGENGAPETRFVTPSPGMAPIPQPVKKEIGPGGQAYNPYALQPGIALNDPNKPFGFGPQGVVPNQAAQDYQLKLRATGRQSVNVNMPPQEKGFETELGKGQAEELLKGRKASDDAVQIINTVNEGRKIMKQGMVTGFGANVIVGIGQSLKQAGIDFGGDATSNAQAFSANMAQNVGKIIKQFGSGTGLSDADREYAIRMAGGQIALDANAINKILDINERQARWIIRQHNTRAKGVKSNIPLTVDEPSSSSQLEEALGRY